METQQIPTGYMADGVGRLVPLESIKEVDLVRNGLVIELMKRAETVSQLLVECKKSSMEDIQAFVELSAEKYGANLGGKVGNVTLTSYDGKFKIVRSMDDFLRFDERLQAAKALIDDCLSRWSDGSGKELRTIVLDAFQVDKAGRINTKRVLSLRKYDFDDEMWKHAMQAISDSIQVESSKAYVRFYQRDAKGDYQQLNLNIAA